MTFFHRYNIESWLCYHFDSSFFNSCFICCWKKIVQSILVKSFFTKTLVEDWTWNMTFTESRYVQSFLNRLKHTVQSRFDLLLADCESQASYRLTISYDSSRYYLYGGLKVEGIAG